jgi:hypothetical protein
MPQFGGKDSKRHFTVVIDSGGKGGTLVPPKEHGLYVSSTPSSAARKAVTKLCTANKSKKVEFYIREITQGSKKKTYGPYSGHIEKLKDPIELKGRVIRYKPVAKLIGKVNKKMKGGEMYDLRNIRKSLEQTYKVELNDEQLTNEFKNQRSVLMNKLHRISEEEEEILKEIQETILRIVDHPSNPAKNNDLNDLYDSRLQQYNEHIKQNPNSIVKDYLDMFKRILTKKKDDKINERRKQKEKNNQLKRNANQEKMEKNQEIIKRKMKENQEIINRKMEEKAQKNKKEEPIKKNLDSIADYLLAQKKISVKNRDYYNIASSEFLEDRHYIIEIQRGSEIYYLCFIKGYYIAYMISKSKSKNFYGIFIVEKTDNLQKIIDELSNYFDRMMPERNWYHRTNKNFGMIQLFPDEDRKTHYPSDNSKIIDDATLIQIL